MWNSSKPWGLWLTVSLPPQYIVLFVAKVLMGQMKEVNDVREYDVEVSKRTATARKKEAAPQLPSALKEGYVVGVTRVQHLRAGGQGLADPSALEPLPKASQRRIPWHRA